MNQKLKLALEVNENVKLSWGQAFLEKKEAGKMALPTGRIKSRLYK